jgi:CheY-like chemotaxis protein
VVEDDDSERQEIVSLIGNGDVETTAVGTGAEALAALQSGHFDCMVLDLILPDMKGFEVLEKMAKLGLRNIPVVINTQKQITEAEEIKLKKYAKSIVIKGAESHPRLLSETALFLHRVESKLPAEKQQILRQIHPLDQALEGKKILIVDDDMRNIFAITSLLEGHGMTTLFAENGKAGIKILNDNPDVDLVLMDIMMPEMDGYETISQMRREERYKTLPIIALTAKAMKGDREKCMNAGASDYISKPVDKDKMLSLLRVWLYRSL